MSKLSSDNDLDEFLNLVAGGDGGDARFWICNRYIKSFDEDYMPSHHCTAILSNDLASRSPWEGCEDCRRPFVLCECNSDNGRILCYGRDCPRLEK
jgi:hypothetical protein